MSGFKDTPAERLKAGDVVVFASGGRVWTVDQRITSSFDSSCDKFRLVSMSVNGLLSEVVVGRSTIRLATAAERIASREVRR